jgi:hypothetical protein
VTLIKVAYGASEIGGRRRNLTTSEQKRTKKNVPSTEFPVFLYDDTVYPRHQEEGHEKSKSGSSSNDDTGYLAFREVHFVVAALPDEKHDNERTGEPKVEWNKDE